VLRTLPDASVERGGERPAVRTQQGADIAEVMRHWWQGTATSHVGAGFMGSPGTRSCQGPSIGGKPYRVLKPGEHALIFCGDADRDLNGGWRCRFAGFEIRDQINWTLRKSGFFQIHGRCRRPIRTRRPKRGQSQNRRVKRHARLFAREMYPVTTEESPRSGIWQKSRTPRSTR